MSENSTKVNMGDAEKVFHFVCNMTQLSSDEISNDTLLYSQGLIDSKSLLELVVFVEQEFQLKVRPEHLILDNWDSISRIEQYIQRSRSADR